MAAVQIGDPLTQKRVSDFLLEAQAEGLYSSITDNGAGGLSSSVGEMATMTDGASIDLHRCPVKYPGLMPYELMISESQERMSLAVRPDKLEAFLSLAQKRGVLATDIGEFTDSGYLEVFYQREIVAKLDLHFLHESLPQMKLKALWDGPREREKWIGQSFKKLDQGVDGQFYSSALLSLLSSVNIASKESLVRRYDHEVQAATHIKPFLGKQADGPGDSGVIWLYPHGGEKQNAISLGCGMAPRISLWDPYVMGQFAVDEAIRNVVAAGGDIKRLCLLDNFCWPDPVKSRQNPDGDYKLAQLVRACYGLYDICCAYGTPLVSGKDSMKNDFRGKNLKGEDLTISILPTLLVTAMSALKVDQSVTTDFKSQGDLIYLLGDDGEGLLGSEFGELYHLSKEEKLPKINLSTNKLLYETYQRALSYKIIKSCHDISDGGLAVAVAESSIGGRLGACLMLDELNMSEFLFNEAPGRFVVSISPNAQNFFEKHFSKLPWRLLGRVTKNDQFCVFKDQQELFSVGLEKIVAAWKGGSLT
jgi:phosphoribosylformylglycinamidine synthase